MSEKIAALGPQGTFSDYAARKYIDVYNSDLEPVYYPSIEEAFRAIGPTCRYGIIPIENTLDGYVQRTLDLMLEQDVVAVDEIIVPVQFSLVGNAPDVSQLKKLYVQFKAAGQCRQFLNRLRDVRITTTESNMESYHKARRGKEGEGAIVPAYVDTEGFGCVEKNVTDMTENYTRFLVLRDSSGDGAQRLTRPTREGNMKIPIFVSPLVDRPGMLFDILRTFNERRINLVAIMSRPTKKIMGTYHFYMEIDAYTGDYDTIMEAAKLIDAKYNLKIMGAYLV